MTVFVAASLFIAMLYLVLSRVEYQETYKHLNLNLDASGIQLNLPEEEAIALLGEGEYVSGLGGHARDYKDLDIRIGIPGDRDNDMYGRVGEITCYSSNCSLYGIKPGDAVADAKSILREQKYTELGSEGLIFENGEYVIMLQGDEQVKAITVYFRDKDLRNRVY
jgi:hypothetical protein